MTKWILHMMQWKVPIFDLHPNYNKTYRGKCVTSSMVFDEVFTINILHYAIMKQITLVCMICQAIIVIYFLHSGINSTNVLACVIFMQYG